MATKKTQPMPKARRLPAGRHLDEVMRGMLAWPRVQVSYIGKKQVGGKETGRLAVVCGVEKKLDKKTMDPAEAVPETLNFRSTPVRTSRVATDVIQMKGSFEVQTNLLGPADLVNPGDPNFEATLGIALGHPVHGNVVTTAGHAIPPNIGNGDQVVVASGGNTFAAQVMNVVTNQFSDHALLRPVSPIAVGNFFRDITPLGPIYIPDPEKDVGKKLFVLPAQGNPRSVTCQGLKASIPTAANIVMHDLILTEWSTLGGDSGACLVDQDYRVWGLLLGVFRMSNSTGISTDFSVFVPAFRVLFLENAHYL